MRERHIRPAVRPRELSVQGQGWRVRGEAVPRRART